MKAIDLVNWELDYTIGVSEIDAQHRELINMVNDMIRHSFNSQAERKMYFAKNIISVSSHIARHFDTEERVLVRTSYEKLTEHKKEHEKITGKIKTIRNELGASSGDATLYNLTITLKEYFLSHILLYDKDAKEFFRAGSKSIASADFHAGIV